MRIYATARSCQAGLGTHDVPQNLVCVVYQICHWFLLINTVYNNYVPFDEFGHLKTILNNGRFRQKKMVTRRNKRALCVKSNNIS